MNSTLQLQVRETEQITSSVKRFVLRSSGNKLPAFGPGAHLRVHLPVGPRHYSLVNNPLLANDEFEIAVKRIGGQQSGSSYLHDVVKVGDTIPVSRPDNYFPLQMKGSHYLFYAAGIGITPILSMMSYLKTISKRFELHYVAKSEEECAFYERISNEFHDETTFYFKSNESINVCPQDVMSSSSAKPLGSLQTYCGGDSLLAGLPVTFEAKQDASAFHMDRSERMKRLKQTLINRKIGTQVYMCGPQAFMDELETYAKQYGYPPHTIHSERFTTPQTGISRKPFKVALAEGDHRMINVATDQSLLETLEVHGIKVPNACRMGICGTCEISVEEGEVEHFDSFLTDEERKTKMLSCVSRGVGQLRIRL